MSLATEVQAKATAPTAPTPVVAGTASKATNRKQKFAAFKQTGEGLRASMSDEERALEGSQSDSIAYVNILGNPKVYRSRVKDGQSEGSYQPVGYRLKAMKDIEVPVIPLKDKIANLTDVDFDKKSTRKVKAGSEFVVNLVENAHLMMRNEIAGTYSGEGQEVYLNVVFSSDSEIPTPIIKASGNHNVKDGMQLIGEKTEVDGKEVYTMFPEFVETFAPIFAKSKATRRNSATGEKEKGKAQKEVAKALEQFYSNL